MRKTLALILALCMIFALCACGQEPVPPEETKEPTPGGEFDWSNITIGWCQTDTQNNWKLKQQSSMEEAAKARGCKLISTNAQGDTAKQCSDFEDLVAQKPDLIVIAPREYEGLTAGFEAAKAAGIPVIVVERLVNATYGEDYVTCLTYDGVLEAVTAGNVLVETFKDQDDVKVVDVQGLPGGSPTIQRAEGLRTALEGHDNITIIDAQTGDYNRDAGYSIMEGMLQTWGKDGIDAVFAQMDDIAIGCCQAIKAAGLVPGKDILVFSIDGSNAGLEAVVAGEIECTPQCNPDYGEPTFELIEKYFKGEKLDPEYLMVEANFDKSNAQEALDKGLGY